MVTMGLFAPLPLALMIPFMAAQSFAMGEAFGKGFQYGKRRISAMTNEEFNKMDAKSHFLETTADIKSMIPEMKAAMSSFALLQQDIIKELIGYIKDTTGTVIEEVKEVHTEISDDFRAFFGAPPVAARLVSPGGIAALIKWWKSFNFKPKTREDARRQLKLDFNYNLDTNLVTKVYDALIDNSFIGPPEPDTIAPPPGDDNTLVLDDEGNVIDSGDVREALGQSGTLRAPSSVITNFNLLNAQIRAIRTMMRTINSSQTLRDRAKDIKVIERKMLALWVKYDLVGKVDSSHYKGEPLR